ncbi:hypothetical protein V501_04846 [Pseudogymnoascus sp. VKM F-4519 (FW-2642)]|nr:hypothetical protein V501_04846 [Pseudogymnoascus sp. VKM F-4519 (FW-2642)]
MLDKLVGLAMLLVASAVFLYYSIWTLLMPFVDPDQPIQQLFPPRVWAIRIPVIIILLGSALVGSFLSIVMIRSNRKKAAKAKLPSKKKAHLNFTNALKPTTLSSSPSATIPTKKERRNAAAKDNSSGGATAINIASKVLDDNKPATPSPPTFTPPVSDVKPVTTATNTNRPGITSPLLDALPSPDFGQSMGRSTTEWARNIPSFSSSPGNLINPSDTPPTVPSSYDDKNTLAEWNQRERKGVNGHNPSASPPSYRRRPVSVQIDGHNPFEDNMSQRGSSMHRRNSTYSQQSQRYASHPPLPHQAQPHFYGAPDINLGLPIRRMGLKPGSQGYFFGLDSINTSRTGSKHTESVVISGFEGGLSVHAISKSGITEISTLDGLRGGVYSAKILPWTVKGELSGGFPLVAAVVHGPAFYENGGEQGSPNLGATEPPAEQTSGSIGNSSRGHRMQGGSTRHYQTTVEVWSLSTKRYVGTLLSLPETILPIPITSPHFVPPAPAGALTVTADAGNIVVSSGITGELWVFRQIKIDNDASMSFRCLGKFWTTIQQPAPYEPSAQPDFGDGDGQFNEARLNKLRPKSTLFSLRGRWLAYSPSSAMNQVSLRARVDISKSNTRIPGLNTFAPPQIPTANCAVDTPQGEEFWGRLRRQAAQEAIKGAKWVGDQGSRVWANYWNKPTNNVNGNWQSSGQKEPLPDFPPTHGAALQYDTSQSDPVLITIVDLDKLATLRNTTSATMATFKVPLGCSYMSFSPTGLALFTASNKGDVQFIWDLMRIQHTKSSALQPQAPGPSQGIHVRQIASFTRLTVARIVDVIWTMPLGETIAMVTERNTVHFLDVPHNAFIWPPLRQRAKTSSSVYPSNIREASPSAAAMASNVANAAWNLTQPFLARPRGASGSFGPIPNRTGAITASLTAIAGQGGKAIASGISKSFGAATGTIQQFRRAGDNKLHLPQTASICSVGCVKWLGGRSKQTFAALVDGHVKMYTIKHVRSKSKPGVYRIHIGTAPADIRIPSIPDNKIAPLIKRKLDLADEEDLEERDAGENRTLLSRPTSLPAGGPILGTESSIPHAEIESNAPYQPFHTDPRVTLFAYSEVSHQLLSPTTSALFSPPLSTEKANRPSGQPWVFGGPIHAANLHVGKEHSDEDALMSSEYHRALPAESMERVTTRIPDDLSEPIVSTTRRRKSSRTTSDLPDDEEGFFEDDCTVIDFASNRV